MTNFEKIKEMSINEMADVFEMREYLAVTFSGIYNREYKAALNWLESEHYNEICKLHRFLEEAKIPHEFERLYDGSHVIYPSKNKQILSAIEHYFSYGKDDDKIEIMGLLTDKEKECDYVKGDLTAENVFDRIKTHYEKAKEH